MLKSMLRQVMIPTLLVTLLFGLFGLGNTAAAFSIAPTTPG